MRSSRLACFVFALMLLAWTASAATPPYIKSVELSKEPLELGKTFDIEVQTRHVESSMEVWVYLDDDILPLKKIVIGPDEQEGKVTVDKDDWDVKFTLKCGTHTLKADLLKPAFPSVVYDTYALEFNVGNVPEITFEPAQPHPGENVKIYLRDRDSGSLLLNHKVTITYEQDYSRESSSPSTDTAGYINYEPSKPGKYKLEVDTKRGYCGEMYFYAKRNMLVDGPNPKEPFVGDMVIIAVPSGDIGVRIYDSNGDFYLAARTYITGAVNFTINDPGDYTLVIGEHNTRYWGVNKTITVLPRPSLNVEIEPSNPYVLGPVTITVKAGDNPLANARVRVVTPAGVQREYATLINGKVIYDGVSTMGEYTVVVDKSGYESVMKTFRAKNGFTVQFEPEVPLLNTQLSLIVKDQDGNVVPDAEISLPDIELVGATDAEGRYSLLLAEENPDVDPGEYTLMVMKDNFWTLTEKIKTQDTLEVRSPREVEVGNDVNVKVYNSRDGLVGDDAISVKITSPDNAISSLNKADFTFKPALIGSYLIEVSKTNYLPASGSVTVKPHPINVTPSIKGKQLSVEVTSHGEPVEGISVSISMLNGRVIQEVNTEEDGIASVTIDSEGNVTITVNERDTNVLYEVKSTGRYVKKSYNILLLVAAAIVIVGLALLIAYMIWHFRTYHHRKDKQRFEPKGRSKLSKL